MSEELRTLIANLRELLAKAKRADEAWIGDAARDKPKGGLLGEAMAAHSELSTAAIAALPALIDHLEADGGVEAMREACAVYVENWRDGLKPLLKTDPRDDFLRGEINAANTLAASIRALPVLGVGR